jgi:hypothetical protein
MLVDKIVIAPHPHKIDKDGRRHYLIRAIRGFAWVEKHPDEYPWNLPR